MGELIEIDSGMESGNVSEATTMLYSVSETTAVSYIKLWEVDDVDVKLSIIGKAVGLAGVLNVSAGVGWLRCEEDSIGWKGELTSSIQCGRTRVEKGSIWEVWELGTWKGNIDSWKITSLEMKILWVVKSITLYPLTAYG